MNKLISVQQIKKAVDQLDEQEQYEIEDELSDIKHFHELSLTEGAELNQSINLNDETRPCQNEKCQEVLDEIKRINEDCSDLEKKIILINKAKTEEFFEISSKLSKVCKEIDEIQPLMDAYQGINLSKMSYEDLVKIEFNLLKLLLKVRTRISEIEYNVMNGTYSKPEDNTTICKLCKEKNIDCLLHPCSHVVICSDCAGQSLKCPICYKFIDYSSKIFLPDA